MTYMYDETTRSNGTNVEHVRHNTGNVDSVNGSCSGREQYEIVSVLYSPSSLPLSFLRTCTGCQRVTWFVSSPGKYSTCGAVLYLARNTYQYSWTKNGYDVDETSRSKVFACVVNVCWLFNGGLLVYLVVLKPTVQSVHQQFIDRQKWCVFCHVKSIWWASLA